MHDRCSFRTGRLVVAPWHEAADPAALAGFVVELLSPAVTASLPPDWGGAYDRQRARSWIADRDDESSVSLVRTATGDPIGLIIVARDGDAARLGFLLAENRWGRGFATDLVGGFVEWAGGRFETIRAGVGVDNPASAAVLERHGFTSSGADDDGERQFVLRPTPSIVVRPERPADRPTIRDLVIAAFGSVDEADLIERIRASPEYEPATALVAVVDGEIVGHVMVSGATVLNAAGAHRIAMLSPLAVAPAHQRRGIGGRLVEAVLRVCNGRGEPFVVLEGAPQYYGRFGFEHAAPLGLTLPLPEWAPSEAGQIRRLPAAGELGRMPVGRVVYPPAFDDLG